ncbi:MAG TPA: glycerol kinase GlpK [Pseudobdellovibrionaceae bacterium]|nr:glycerol kinase GlpK [Pseudobdellovibrionaceae bacterium]
MGSTNILSLDQGTTGSTASLMDGKGLVSGRADLDFRQYFPEPGWVEHKPDDIWKSLLEPIQSVIKKTRVKPGAISAIGITNQRETVVIWDRKTGRPLYNAIVWQDRRTTEICERLKAEGVEPMLREKTGLVIDPYFSATKLAWILDHVSGARSRAERGELAAGTIDTYVLWKLTGGKVHRTDVSNASRTQLMNLATCDWDDDLLRLFKVPREILPEICDSNALFGVTSGLRFLPDGIPITGIAGDQQAALFGQLCLQVGEAKCTFGTGSFLLMNTGAEKLRSKAGLLTTVAWRLRGEKQATYALEGGAFVCGAAVQFLRDQLGFIKDSGEVEKLAASVKDSGGVEFVPALTGLGAPHWDPRARGLICGLTRGTTRAHIARATLEAMALQNAEILLAMDEDLRSGAAGSGGSKLARVLVDGGASANNLLMQMQADVLGTNVVRPKNIETTSAGAAFLAGLGVGAFASTATLKNLWRADKSFAPKMKDEDRQARLKRWRTAIRRATLVEI